MSYLGFANESQVERTFIEQAWTLLNKGEQKEDGEGEEDNRSVGTQSLKVFLSAVMNFDFPWMKRAEQSAVEGEEKPKFKVNPKQIGSFEDGSLKLAAEEIAWVNSHFTLMQANRNNFVSHQKKEKKMDAIKEEGPALEEAPRPNEKSVKMLAKKEAEIKKNSANEEEA
jgi:hypothetical protein